MSKRQKIDYNKVKIKKEKLSPPPAPRMRKTTDEIVNEIIPNLFGTPPRKDDDDDENKKAIEPVKSSNEILAELFKVFNAAPPQTLLNDEYLLKKKKHKKEKKRKKKSKKRDSSRSDSEDKKIKEEDGERTDKESIKSDKSRKKHKKNKKTSKSKSKSTERRYDDIDDYSNNDERNSEKQIEKYKEDIDSDFVISDAESVQHRHHSHHQHRNHSGDRLQQREEEETTPVSSGKIIIKSVKNSKVFREAEEKEKQSKQKLSLKNTKKQHDHDKSSSKSKDREVFISSKKDSMKRESSEISLSDEESYLREKESLYRGSDSFYGDRKSNSRYYDSYYNDRSSRGNYRDTSRDRSRGRYHYDRRRSRSRSRSRRYGRSRSRSRSRSNELMIDKKRLLEIARKNAISMFKNGSLPGTQGMTEEIKDKVLMRMRYGGKSVEELTEFCKKLSQGENINELSDLSSNEDSDHDKYGNDKAFHHPFVLKDRGPIVMNIKNATQIPPKTAEQTKAILMQYPVSSGQQHRLTESEWVPVSPKRPDPSPAQQSSAAKPQIPAVPKNIFQKPLPLNEEQKPAFVPTLLSNNTTTVITTPTTISSTVARTNLATTTTTTAAIIKPLSPPPPSSKLFSIEIPTLPLASPVNIPAAPSITNTLVPAVVPVPAPAPQPQQAIIKAKESIFPQQNSNIDVSTVIAKRLNAMRKLQENPTDPEALKMMYDAQKNMSAWANSKYTPGQFTGSTGANILSAKELNSGFQAWAKRDQLTSSTPVSGGMGMHLLQKMGWRPGEGLGKTKNGALQPLLLDVKMDKRGLVATEEDPTIARLKRKRERACTIEQVNKSFEEKHPVSLLDEISAKRKWGPPVYDVVTDDGPSHRKNFVFQVVVNGVIYRPTIPCRTKKEAKALAAKYCLQQLGVLNC